MVVLYDQNVQCVIHFISWWLLGWKNLFLFDALVVLKKNLRFNALFLQGVQHYLNLVLDPNNENKVGFLLARVKIRVYYYSSVRTSVGIVWTEDNSRRESVKSIMHHVRAASSFDSSWQRLNFFWWDTWGFSQYPCWGRYWHLDDYSHAIPVST